MELINAQDGKWQKLKWKISGTTYNHLMCPIHTLELHCACECTPLLYGSTCLAHFGFTLYVIIQVLSIWTCSYSCPHVIMGQLQ